MIATIVRGVQRRPRRVLLYGTHGIGKSTWAAQSPSPVFIPTEDGAADIGVDRFPVCKTVGDVNSAISQLIQAEHEYKTAVLDTADWYEKLAWAAVAEEAGKASIEEIGYGKGYMLSCKHWEFLLKSLDALRDHRNMAIIILAHARVVRFNSPDGDAYDRYEPDLHKTVVSTVQEWADEVFFARYEEFQVKEDMGFNKERTRAVGEGRRIVWTSERPTHLAKRRARLPDTMPLDFNEYRRHLLAAQTPATPPANGNIQGVVNNGSSKPEKAEV